MEKIYYKVDQDSNTRVITLYHNNTVIAELNCYNDLLSDWEEIDMFLDSEDLYSVYGDNVEFEAVF